MADEKRRAKSLTSKKPTAVEPPTRMRRWSNAQKLTLCISMITFLGLVLPPILPAVFANWDKLTKAAKPEVDATDVRAMLLENRKQDCFARIEAVEESVDNAVNAIRCSTTKPSEQQKAAKAADELKGVIKVHRPRIEKAYERLHQAIKTGNTIESDVRQNELHKEVLDLQRNFDKKLQAPLKQYVDVDFQNYDRRPPRVPRVKIVTNDRK